MIIDAARLAGHNLLAPQSRVVLWNSLGLTLAVLVAVFVAARGLFSTFAMPWLVALFPGMPEWVGWLGALLGIVALLGLALALALLVAPVTALVAGLFLDDIAELIETRDYPGEPTGRAVPVGRSIIYTLKFLGIVIAGNLVALALLLVPGVNVAAFFLVNGYLLGREFFEFAAMRYRPEAEARRLRQKHATTVFLAGLVIAAFLAVPLINLLTPLFGAALMVHLHKMISAREPGLPAMAMRAA